MADAGEDGVDSITFDAEQEVSAEMAIGFHVADDRLDGGAAAQLAADGGGDAALLAADENAGPIGIVAAIAAIDIGTGDGGAGDPHIEMTLLDREPPHFRVELRRFSAIEHAIVARDPYPAHTRTLGDGAAPLACFRCGRVAPG